MNYTYDNVVSALLRMNAKCIQIHTNYNKTRQTAMWRVPHVQPKLRTTPHGVITVEIEKAIHNDNDFQFTEDYYNTKPAHVIARIEYLRTM